MAIQNLLINGALENGIAANTSTITKPMPGWTAANYAETWGSGANGGLRAKDGGNFVEIDAGTGGLSQAVRTTAGKSYELSFDLAGRTGYVASSKLDVFWNSQKVGTVNPTDAAWKSYKFTVTGTGGNDKLTFQAVAGDTDTVGALLDNVYLGNPITDGDTGSWDPLKPWPFVAIHAVVLPNGKVFTYGSDANADPYNTIPKNGVMKHDVYDPLTGTHQTIDHTHTTPTDIFCSAAVIIPGTDQVMIVGGDTRPTGPGYNRGVDDTNIFDVSTGHLNKSPDGDMNYARWYATTLSLPTGQIVTMGGIDQNGTLVRTPEIWTPGEGWRALTGAATADLDYYYPRMWQGKDGKIVYVSAGGGNNGVTEVMQLDPKGNGAITKLGQLPFAHDGNSPAIMYESGKVLFMATDGQLWTMDMNGGVPAFVKGQKLSQNRDDANMTVMADGKVLITGGTASGNNEAYADKTATVWDPATGQIADMGDEAQPRMYHSTAVLLQDGSILSMGGGFAASAKNQYLDSQIYKPAYLFDANGNPATRPVITSDTESVAPGKSFTITVDDAAAIAKLTFVKTGATTHAFNMDANFVNLSFTKGANNTITVTLPQGVDKVPAGSWMLFAWNDKGVPSIADMVDVKPTLSPFAYDGTGGTPIDPDAPPAPNLIVNGTFENSEVGLGKVPAGWTLTGAGGVDNTAARSADGGKYFAFDGWGNAHTGVLSQTIDTVIGQSYVYTFKAKATTFGANGLDAQLKMDALNGATIVGTKTVAIGNGMAEYAMTFTATSSKTIIKLSDVSAKGQRDFDIDVDRVSVKADGAAPPPDPNMAVNGGFETVAGAHAGMPMEIVATNSQAGPWQSSTNRIEVWTEGKNGVAGTEGKNVVEVNAQNGTLSQAIKTEAGKAYGITFDYAGQAGAIASSKVEVLWNGAVIATINPADAAFKSYHTHAIGTGGNDVLAFRAVAGDSDDKGGLLDNVVFKLSDHPVDPPVGTLDAVDDAFRGAAGQAITGNVLANDQRPAGAGTHLMVHDQPDNGTLTLNQDGSFSYTPRAGFSGADSFTYMIMGGTAQDTATVRLTVDPPGGGGVITGTAGDDYLVDTDANDVMKGGAGMDGFLLSGRGDDTVDGEGGDYNQVELRGSAANYAFTRNADGTITVSSAAHGTDTLKNIQGFWFIGENKWYAADTLAKPGGTGGTNTITGTAGDDYLVDTDANDVMKGGAGMDGFLLSGKGDDTVDGEGGDYNQVELLGSAANYAVTRNADGTITVSSTAHGTDTLKNIQGFWFIGENKWYAADTLAKPGGTGGTNTITGTAGDDYLVDTDANDVMKGGAGMDGFLLSGRGDDTVDGEGGYNQVELNGAASDYAFHLNADGTIRVSSAAHGTDTLKNIQGFWLTGEQKWYAADTLAPAHDHAMMAAMASPEDDDVSDGSREAAAAKASAVEAATTSDAAPPAEANDNVPMQESAFALPDQAGGDAGAVLPDPHAHDFVPDDHHQAA